VRTFWLWATTNIWGRYLGAATLAVIAVVIKVHLTTFDPSSVPTYFLAITIASCYGGRGPGLLASAIVSLSHLYYIIPPADSFAIQSTAAALEFSLFAVGTFIVSSIAASLYEAKTRLKQANKEVLEYARHRLQFVANVTHEIRTPLNAIVGLSRLLREGAAEFGSEKTELALQVSDASQILLNQVNDILDYAKLESGHFTIQQQNFSLREKIVEAIDLVRPLTKDRKIQFQLQIDPTLPDILVGDAGRILQILWNFLSNAAKFTTAGSIAVGAESLAQKDSAWTIRISVKDTGPGIPEAELEQIFLPFIQSHSTSNRGFGGTGLGLSISKKLALLMEGTVGASSQLGRGSIFWLDLTLPTPTLAVLSETQRAKAQIDQPLLKPEVTRPGKILCVDDNELNLLVIRKFAEKLGYAIDVAENGQQAVDLCTKHSYQVVLMDCQIPILDGYAAAQAIRRISDPVLNSVPILATTAFASPETQRLCTISGMNDFISKPIDFDELAVKLHRWSTAPTSALS